MSGNPLDPAGRCASVVRNCGAGQLLRILGVTSRREPVPADPNNRNLRKGRAQANGRPPSSEGRGVELGLLAICPERSGRARSASPCEAAWMGGARAGSLRMADPICVVLPRPRSGLMSPFRQSCPPAPRSVMTKDEGKARASGALEPPRGDRALPVRSVDARARASLGFPRRFGTIFDSCGCRTRDSLRRPRIRRLRPPGAPRRIGRHRRLRAPNRGSSPDLDTRRLGASTRRRGADRGHGPGGPARIGHDAPDASPRPGGFPGPGLRLDREQLHLQCERPAGNGQNFGVNPNNQANRWMGNQYYLIIENPLEQND